MLYKELDSKNPVHKVILKVFEESEPEGTEEVEITCLDERESYISQRYSFRIDSVDDPCDDYIHCGGTIIVNQMQNAVLLDIDKTNADPVTCMLNLDNNYVYYFHR